MLEFDLYYALCVRTLKSHLSPVTLGGPNAKLTIFRGFLTGLMQ